MGRDVDGPGSQKLVYEQLQHMAGSIPREVIHSALSQD